MKIQKINQMPLKYLWNEKGMLPHHRISFLNTYEVKEKLTSCTIVMANIGDELKWYSPSDNFTLWKLELFNHICNDPKNGCAMEDFSGDYFYFASYWEGNIVLLEKQH